MAPQFVVAVQLRSELNLVLLAQVVSPGTAFHSPMDSGPCRCLNWDEAAEAEPGVPKQARLLPGPAGIIVPGFPIGGPRSIQLALKLQF